MTTTVSRGAAKRWARVNRRNISDLEEFLKSEGICLKDDEKNDNEN